ncbi:MAG: hypothetical protein OXL96_16565 [Candidatus Poribacteria bacterium]|nr:hypothetical protein [Candidatus Poribacteria bacterium]
MFIRKYWLPLSVFLVAIAGMGLYLLATQQPPEPVKIYKVVEPEKPTEQPTGEVPESETDTGGHFHADGTWHERPHDVPVPVYGGVDGSKTLQVDSDGEVIYPHHELLQSHPVEALRQQSIDRGHWSAEWIPPFPVGDVEANELARSYYLAFYYNEIGDFHNPIASQARAVIRQWRDHFNSYIPSRRWEIPHRDFDLMKLAWIQREYDARLLEMDIPSSFSRDEYKPSNAPTTYTPSTFIPEDDR